MGTPGLIICAYLRSERPNKFVLLFFSVALHLRPRYFDVVSWQPDYNETKRRRMAAPPSWAYCILRNETK